MKRETPRKPAATPRKRAPLPDSVARIASLARDLLATDSIDALATIAQRLVAAQAPGARSALFWLHDAGPNQPAPLHCTPDAALSWAPAALAQAAMRARVPQRSAAAGGAGAVDALPVNAGAACCGALVVEATPEALDLLRADDELGEALALLGQRVNDLLYRHRIEGLLRGTREKERLQRALYALSDLAGREIGRGRMLRNVHRIVRTLMYAENFFVALYDRAARTISFPYFADVHDLQLPDPDAWVPERELANTLTLSVLQHSQPLMGPSAEIRSRLGIPYDDDTGPDSEDWLGVPMLVDGLARGAIVVQSYDRSRRFDEANRDLLSYVAQHILVALTRRQAHEDLEQRVEARTRELADANRELVAQVREREHGERLQAALFRIAEVTSTTSSMYDFYAAVHAVVGELLVARNFFVALLVEDDSALDFPYAADEVDGAASFERREMRRGLTDYVLRTGRALLADRTQIAALHDTGGIELVGTPAECWLGVPLVLDGRVAGAIVVQSYTSHVQYSVRDQELLTFVSFHIATALQRRRARESLELANAELEQRVEELRLTQAELLETEKMASLGRLVAGVAHEVNTPLGIALTAVSFLRDQIRALRSRAGATGIALDADALEHAGAMVESNLGRAAALIRNFKQVAVDQSTGNFRAVELREYLGATLQSLHPTLRRTALTVAVECDPALRVTTRADALHQIVVNLVMNSVTHAYADGEAGTIRITVSLHGDRVRLRYEDDGAGMSPQVAAHMFEPFFTTRREQGGTGLGMHIVYNLVAQALAGRIQYETSPGAGVRFDIVFPLVHPQCAAALQRAPG